MISSEMYERVAKNVGCSLNELLARHKKAKDTHAVSLVAAGVSEAEVENKTLRMAAAEMRAEKARLSRSGCTMLEGMFLSSPRYKDWGKVFYTKYQNMLKTLDEEGRKNLVAQGLITLYLHDDSQGGYRIIHNPTLTNKTPFAVELGEMSGDKLPKQATDIGDGTGYFVCIENKSSPTYPSGSPNYAYGKARATSDLERTCLFLGRQQGSGDALKLIPMKFRGDLAKVNYPTFSPLQIPANLSKNGVAYTKAGVSEYTLDSNLASIFPKAPLMSDGSGLIPDHIHMLDGLDFIEDYVNGLDDKEKWDALVCVVMEVAHIDPRESGGYILTLSDLDLTSLSAPLDLYVSREEDSKVSFGVGSVVAVVGSPYVSRDGDGKLATTGWFCVDEVGVLTDTDSSSQTELDDWE